MRVSVTGGFGYVGAHLVKHLRSLGHEVSVVSLEPPADDVPAEVASVPFRLADITDRDALAGVFDGCDAVVHAAAMGAGPASTHPAASLAVNGAGTRNVLDEAVAAGVSRLVYMSTYHVYGQETGTITELAPARPVAEYGISKQAGEGFCFRASRRGEIEVAIARFSNGFGAPLSRSADCWTLAFPSFCLSAATEGRVVLRSAGMQQRDFLAISDMCSAISLLLTTADLGTSDTDIVFNVGGGDSLSMRQAAAIVLDAYEELAGTKLELVMPAGSKDAPAGPAVDYRFERIASLGYRPQGDLAAEARATLRMLGVSES